MTLLETKGLSINFGELWAVNNIDFQIAENETIGLIGPNGSGKTTFFNLISMIYKPTKGSIFLKGEDVTNLLPHQAREKGISRTFQSSKLLWSLSVLDNVLSGMYVKQKAGWFDLIFNKKLGEKETEEGIEKAFELLGFFNPELIDRRFDKAENIPHIDRRRLEICRALASNPALLLLDEPSAGLNREETKAMMDDIGKIRETQPGLSIIIIEHDMSVISGVSDRCFALNYGKKICEGCFSEVSANPEVRQAYLGEEAAC